jgi:hypothetical protein
VVVLGRFALAVVFAATAAASMRGAEEAGRLTVDVAALADMPARQLDAMIGEAAALWRSAGATLVWRRVAALDRTVPPAVVVVADDFGGTVGRARLGSITLGEGDATRPLVHLSIRAVEGLVFEQRWGRRRLREAPVAARQQVVGRALGRVLAHELGHFLLAWRGHVEAGLMRSSFPPEELAAADVRPFALTETFLPRLKARLNQLDQLSDATRRLSVLTCSQICACSSRSSSSGCPVADSVR